jgi:hypothetical protein
MLSMKNKIISALTVLLVLAVGFLFSSSALAADCSTCSGQSNLNTAAAIQCGSNCAGGSSQTPAQASKNIGDTLTSVIQLFTIVVGAVAVVMLVIGGFRYVSSAGSQEGVASAKKTITYALIGIVIAALSQLIVTFVLTKTQNSIK